MKKILIAAAMLGAMSASAGVNLLQNGDFTVSTVGWASRTRPAQKIETADSDKGKALKITITEPKAKDHGQIIQIRQGVKPNALYRVSSWVKAPNDAAYVQIKLMRGKKEGKRISTGTCKGDGWVKLEKDIQTEADTTGIQVLLRFRMNEGLKGKTIEFADVRLEGISGGAETDAAPAKAVMPKPPEPVKDVVAAAGKDVYVSPAGSGKKDGTSAANAAAANRNTLQSLLPRLGPGNTLFIAAGQYSGDWQMELAAGGTKDKPIKICGMVKNGAKPVITGSWKRTKPSGGTAFLTLKPGVSFIEIENLDLRNFRSALIARGPNHEVKVRKVDLFYCRDGYVLDGGMVDGLPDSASGGFEMSDCKILFHTKKGVRTSNGFHHAKFVRCIADGGGKDYANIEPRDIFSVGFQVLGSYRGKGGRKVDHHIEFIDCEANNNYYDPTPKRYWNADGFCTEAASSDISFIRCKASGNTDGGWDVKTPDAKFIDCVGSANKRNFRVWTRKGEVTVFKGCLSENSVDYGKQKHSVGFWMLGGGTAEYENCVSKNDPRPFSIEAHGKEGEPPPVTTVKIRDCKVSPKPERLFFRSEGDVKVDGEPVFAN